MGAKRKKGRAEKSAAIEDPVVTRSDGEGRQPEEGAEEETARAAIAPDVDIEAAMEEDITGRAEGVSLRNPEPAPTAAYIPPLSSVYAEGFGAIHPRRSGLEEAEWFQRFRERLVGSAGPDVSGVMSETAPETAEEPARDPDDPPSDEAQAYSESGE